MYPNRPSMDDIDTIDCDADGLFCSLPFVAWYASNTKFLDAICLNIISTADPLCSAGSSVASIRFPVAWRQM